MEKDKTEREGGEPPEPDLTKREKWATRRCQARAIFEGGASINLDLDHEATSALRANEGIGTEKLGRALNLATPAADAFSQQPNKTRPPFSGLSGPFLLFLFPFFFFPLSLTPPLPSFRCERQPGAARACVRGKICRNKTGELTPRRRKSTARK